MPTRTYSDLASSDLESYASSRGGGYQAAHQLKTLNQERLTDTLITALTEDDVHVIGIEFEATTPSGSAPFSNVDGRIGISVMWFLQDASADSISPAIHAFAIEGSSGPEVIDAQITNPGGVSGGTNGSLFVCHYTGDEANVDATHWENAVPNVSTILSSNFSVPVLVIGPVVPFFSTAEVWRGFGTKLTVTSGGGGSLTVQYSDCQYRNFEWLLHQLKLVDEPGVMLPQHPFTQSDGDRMPDWAPEHAISGSFNTRRLKRNCDDEGDVCIVAYRSADGKAVVYYAENRTYYDIDLSVSLSVFEDHVEGSVPDSTRKIVPPKDGGEPGRMKLIKLPKAMARPPMPGFSYELGDPNATHTKPGYTLPFPVNKAYQCSQGFNNSNGTHAGMYAVDFDMPKGSAVTAARGGVVVSVGRGRRNSWTVMIRHSDGTYGLYAHLTPKSQVVTLGQQVAPGDELAKSGNSGQSTGPHLHFHVSKADDSDGFETIPWKFDGSAVKIDGNAPSSGLVAPQAGKTYKRTR